ALRLGIDRHDGRLRDDDAAIAHVHQRVRGAEVDADVAGEEAEQTVEHGDGSVSLLVDAGRAAWPGGVGGRAAAGLGWWGGARWRAGGSAERARGGIRDLADAPP